ncbi:hypothetical protein Slit_0067 [Sideroxydans lithotrophicus ES-1]|uniref:Uncharacterized protein n=2 Tax=Sideroxydans TaxID=314343 RepID=D5CTK3_SIDLE|nr:hypothetical protein Slit_0067 [Sideroxydans lithotrophicus ES-1]
MPGEMEIMFSLAGRMHVLLRREINRIIDVEWMCIDAGYAKEVIKLARSAEADELHKLADRIEAVHPLLPRIEFPEEHVPVMVESKYLKTLR